MRSPTRADQPHGYYQNGDGLILRVSELVPNSQNADSLLLCASGITRVRRRSLERKLVPKALRHDDLDVIVQSPEDQAATIVASTAARRAARYFITTQGVGQVEHPDDVRAFIRVHNYRPRNLLQSRYPNVTDLETLNGQLLEEQYSLDARILLYYGLQGTDPLRKVSAYTEEPSHDARIFYGSVGFNEVGTVIQTFGIPPEGSPAAPIAVEMVHMEADQAGKVQDYLQRHITPHIID